MTDGNKEWVGFSFDRVWTIGVNTLTEAMRQKVLNILLLCGLIMIAAVPFFRQFTFGDPIKCVKDTCLGAISVFGVLIAIVGTAQLLPNEVEQRTIYTILAKPVRRFEFLLGKFTGSALLIFLSTFLMSVMFAAVLYLMMVFAQERAPRQATQELMLGASLTQTNGAVAAPSSAAIQKEVDRTVQQLRHDVLDSDIVKGILLILVKLLLLAGVTLLISTFSTSMVFNVVAAIMILFAGHLVGTAKEMWAQIPAARWCLAVIPDLGMFNVTDDISLGKAIPWRHVGAVAAYGMTYCACVVVAAHFIFEDREI
jgi:ABC-type transport system involved in multi-copper enzyme maturation permease subunit